MDCKETQSLVMDYLNLELGGEILDDFLHHIRGCRECYEELEIYYIIHFAMQRLDSEELVSYDIKGMLEEDLREAERTVRKWKLKRSWLYGFILIAELLLCFIIFTQIQNLKFGGIEETWLYDFLFNG